MPDDSILSDALQSKSSTNADPESTRREVHEGDDDVLFNVRVPPSLKEDFKNVCKRDGRTMSWVIREYMRRCVEADETGL